MNAIAKNQQKKKTSEYRYKNANFLLNSPIIKIKDYCTDWSHIIKIREVISIDLKKTRSHKSAVNRLDVYN